MSKFLNCSFILSILFSIGGCTTIGTLGEEDNNNKVFSGTLRQFELGCAHGVCIDFPFSLVADAVLLPVTIPWSVYNVSTDRAEKYKKSQEANDGVPESIKRNGSE